MRYKFGFAENEELACVKSDKSNKKVTLYMRQNVAAYHLGHKPIECQFGQTNKYSSEYNDVISKHTKVKTMK